jgi:hypothetical protein
VGTGSFLGLSHCVHKELDGKAELENVFTLSGNSTQAVTLPCIKYVDLTWGTIGKQIIRLIEDALAVQRLYSSSDRITSKRSGVLVEAQPLTCASGKMLGGMELTSGAHCLVEEKAGFPSKIAIHGSLNDCETTYQVIRWVTATFRRPEPVIWELGSTDSILCLATSLTLWRKVELLCPQQR